MPPILNRRPSIAGLFAFVAWSFVFLGAANIEIPTDESIPSSEEFGRLVTRGAIQLQEVAPKRSLKLKLLNDSLEKTALAARMMASKGDLDQARQILEKAKQDYKENSFASLLLGIIANAQGARDQSSQSYEEFLLTSRTFTDFDKLFLTWAEFHKLRRIIYDVLLARGINFKDREQSIQVRIPFEKLTQYIMSPGPQDRLLNILFVASILAGAALLLLAAFWGADFSKFSPKLCLAMYFSVWIAYALWIVDLAFGLPFGWNRFQVIPRFLIGAFSAFAVTEGLYFWEERTRPLEPGYQRCPFCKKIIPTLSAECPECHRGL